MNMCIYILYMCIHIIQCIYIYMYNVYIYLSKGQKVYLREEGVNER